MGDALSESEVIRRVAQRFAALAQGNNVEIGIGDDTAVLRLDPQASGRQLLTTDTLIEGVHFDLRYMTLADVGYKALAVNLSDINAMGGESVAALGTLGVPPGATTNDVDRLLDGVADALELCRSAGQDCSLIGGDTVAAPQWVIGFTVLGHVEGAALLRSGMRLGDELWHSGSLGLSGIGLHQLWGGGAPVQANAIAAHLRPAPPLALGPWLHGQAIATAAQDLSDSLSQVALQMSAASNVAVELDFRDYDFAAELHEFADSHRVRDGDIVVSAAESPGGGELHYASIAELLLAQGEDYELLFSIPADRSDALRDAPATLTRIGTVIEGNKSTYIDEHGNPHMLHATGFEHFQHQSRSS